MKRLCAILLSVFLSCGPILAQSKKGECPFLGFFDDIMSSGKIAKAGKAVPSGKVFEPLKEVPVAQADGTLNASDDFEFINYLIDNDLKEDAVALTCSSVYAPSDTLDFLRGWTLYQTKRLAQSSEWLGKVPFNSPLKEKALFFDVALCAHMGEYERSNAILDEYREWKKNCETDTYGQLWLSQRAGIALLENDSEGFIALSKDFDARDFTLSESQNNLISLSENIPSHKSAFIGCAASAIVPGLGKIYAGRLGEGITSFLTIAGLSAVTAESWKNYGASDWRTIAFGSLGALFYIGNIYGTYVSVSLYNNDIDEKHRTAILYNIHIPLYSIFR